MNNQASYKIDKEHLSETQNNLSNDLTKLISSVMLKAIEDLKIKNESQNAYQYFNSDVFLEHCSILGLDPSFVLARNLCNRPEYIAQAFVHQNNRHNYGKKSTIHHNASKIFIKDHKKLSSIVAPK